MRLSLVPKSTGFYELFAKAGENAAETARKAEVRFREWPSPSVSQDELKQLEHVGDEVTYEIIQLLNTQYVTPFDREDIYELAARLDDVVDYIEHASQLLELYGVEAASRHATEQCAILVKAVDRLAAALAGLKGRKDAQAALVEVKQHEDEGDRIHRDALASLFRDPRIDPLIVIRWKDIYEALEEAIDACETAANVIGNIIVKNT